MYHFSSMQAPAKDIASWFFFLAASQKQRLYFVIDELKCCKDATDAEVITLKDVLLFMNIKGSLFVEGTTPDLFLARKYFDKDFATSEYNIGYLYEDSAGNLQGNYSTVTRKPGQIVGAIPLFYTGSSAGTNKHATVSNTSDIPTYVKNYEAFMATFNKQQSDKGAEVIIRPEFEVKGISDIQTKKLLSEAVQAADVLLSKRK